MKVTIKEPTQEIVKGDICTIIDIFPNDIYQVSDEAGHHWLFVEKMLESAVPTLAVIKEKKLTCVVHTPIRNGAEIIVNTIPVDDEGTIDCDWSSFWDTYKDDTCYEIVDGELYSYQSKEFFEKNSHTICEFSDLFPVGSTMVCGDRMYQRTESGITNYKLVEEDGWGGIVTLKPRDESVSFASAPNLNLSCFILPTNSREFEEKLNKELAEHFNAFPNGFRGGKKPEYVLNEKQAKEYADNIMATAESISHITGISYENSINKLKTCLSAFPNDGISAKMEGKIQ